MLSAMPSTPWADASAEADLLLADVQLLVNFVSQRSDSLRPKVNSTPWVLVVPSML